MTHRPGPLRRAAAGAVRLLLRWGLGPRQTYLLTAEGRPSSPPVVTPVTLVEEHGFRWLVAPDGDVGWVHHARAAGEVTLSRGRRSETVVIFEVEAAEAAPILKRYVREVPVARPFFDVSPDDDLGAFRSEAQRHPVFRVVATTP